MKPKFQVFFLGGDKRDRTADLLNAIHALIHFSRKTGRKGPVFPGFLPPFGETVRSNSTRIPLFSGAVLEVGMADKISPAFGEWGRVQSLAASDFCVFPKKQNPDILPRVFRNSNSLTAASVARTKSRHSAGAISAAVVTLFSARKVDEIPSFCSG